MIINSLVLVVALSAALFSACSTPPTGRLVYKQSQFASRLEYMRVCQQSDLQGRHCE